MSIQKTLSRIENIDALRKVLFAKSYATPDPARRATLVNRNLLLLCHKRTLVAGLELLQCGEKASEQVTYSIVAIDPKDGITVGHFIVYGANTRDEAEAAYLRGESQRIAILDPRDEEFYDGDPTECILSCDRLVNGIPA